MRKKIVFIVFLFFITASLVQAKTQTSNSLTIMFKEPTSLLDRTPIDAGYKLVKEGSQYVTYQLEYGKDWKKSPQQPFLSEKCKKCTSDEGLLVEAGKYFSSPLISYAINSKTDHKITGFDGKAIPIVQTPKGKIDLKNTLNNVVKASLADKGTQEKGTLQGSAINTKVTSKKCCQNPPCV